MSEKSLREQWGAGEVEAHYILEQYEQLQTRCAELSNGSSHWFHKWNVAEDEKAQQQERIAEAAKWLEEAAEDIEDWGCYAGEYFRDRHDLAGDVARVREQVKRLRESTPHPAESEDGHLTLPCTQCGGAGWVDPVEDNEEVK